MKTLLNCLMGLIASLSLVSCLEQPRIKNGKVYPDLISPIYYIDTFQVISPRVAVVDSIPYIFSGMMPFEDKEGFLMQKGVVRYLTPEMNFHRAIYYARIHEYQNVSKTLYLLMNQNEFYFDEMFFQIDSIDNIPVFKFVYEPETYLLTLISTIDSVVMDAGHEDVVMDIIFSKNYMLALAPIYRKEDLRKINELWDRRIYSIELD
jgi:hypothetical protein